MFEHCDLSSLHESIESWIHWIINRHVFTSKLPRIYRIVWEKRPLNVRDLIVILRILTLTSLQKQVKKQILFQQYEL